MGSTIYYSVNGRDLSIHYVEVEGRCISKEGQILAKRRKKMKQGQNYEVVITRKRERERERENESICMLTG
ncbi:hypothetical protein PRUPE_5G088700 [Prunus persica]|uniref:Uncharacterized protein n=1 Tax=Prunus persica TaxID=3760 RepID=A0A251P5T7_PRUPE|nr:hypothetical protein PRUPE_5G088700 [Prunus persica]